MDCIELVQNENLRLALVNMKMNVQISFNAGKKTWANVTRIVHLCLIRKSKRVVLNQKRTTIFVTHAKIY